jgi:hypothetical protein
MSSKIEDGRQEGREDSREHWGARALISNRQQLRLTFVGTKGGGISSYCNVWMTVDDI